MMLACLSLLPVQAQMGGRGGGMGGSPGPQIGARMAKLFGDNSAFSAAVEMQTTAGGQAMTIPGNIAFADGKARFDLDMAEMKGAQMPPEAMNHMKSMGMDKMTTISLPDKKVTYLVYPGLKAYAEMPIQDPEAAKSQADFKMETTELGRETVEGHPCVKNMTVVTDDKGAKHEYNVWNATDLKKFPVKLQYAEHGNTMIILFKNVKLAKPDAGQFEPPANFKKYDSMGTMMQQEMMKRMGAGGGMPPGEK